MAMEMGLCGPIPKRSRPVSVSPSTGVGELVGVDRISDLPDVILGDIVTLLPMEEGARTQILASRWRRIWRCSALLNLDFHAPLVARTRRRRRRRRRGLRDDELAGLISRILSSHQGTGRRFCIPSSFRFSNQAATVESWLQSAALDNIQELNLWHTNERLPDYLPLPRSAISRFSATLRVATIAHCKLPDSTVQGLQFPHLKQLGLKQVLISEHSMHHIIAACPALECLMIERIFGFCCVRINSLGLRSIGVGTGPSRTNELQVVELVVDNAPCLKRLLHLQMDACLDMHITVISAPKQVLISEHSMHHIIAACPALECLMIERIFGFCCVRINSLGLRSIGVGTGPSRTNELQVVELVVDNAPCLKRLLHLQMDACLDMHITVISAPKLETFRCCLSQWASTRFAVGSAPIQGLHVDGLAMVVRTVQILAVDMSILVPDKVIFFMRCFPCLEKLYIQSSGWGVANRWRLKHRDLIPSLDIRLKTIVFERYRGTRSEVSFLTFFVFNARVLELMTLQIAVGNYNEKFLAEQRRKLQLENRASRGAQFQFRTGRCVRSSGDIKDFYDLDLTDPFVC